MRELKVARVVLAGAWTVVGCHPSRVAHDGKPASSTGATQSAPVAASASSSPSARAAAASAAAPAATSNAFAPAATPTASTCAASGEPGLGLPAPTPSASDPFGFPSTFAAYACQDLHRSASFRPYLAAADTKVAFVDGDDWLALVNRSPTGALSPEYAPSDLVDLKDGRPRSAAECGAQRECLRHDAAVALRAMLDAMRRDGLEGVVQSAFRAYGTQCWVFESWAHQARGGFCEATEQSALPGHSQHQLGTTLDLFTKIWADEGVRSGRGVFRDGFGCSRGGRWLDDQAYRFGFVVPYSIHPDDRQDGSRCVARTDRPVPIDPKTGYKSEPWHVRFVGVEAAARYHAAWLASGPGTPGEITLEQWIRAQRGLEGDTEVPVCDGCQCGACATLASDDARTPCGKASLWLDDLGRVVRPPEPPRLVDAYAVAPSVAPTLARPSRPSRHAEIAPAPAGDKVVVLEAVVVAPPHTPTQPPVLGPGGPIYDVHATYLALAPYAGTAPHRYPDLPGAWRIGIELLASTPDAPASPTTDRAAPDPRGERWPWRASLASPHLEQTWNRANVVLPAEPGSLKVRISLVVPEGTRGFAVTLLRDGIEHDTRDVPLP